jgi:hypothetical protein
MNDWIVLPDKGCVEGLAFDFARMDLYCKLPSATKAIKNGPIKAKILLNECADFKRIYVEKDLRLRPGFNISPPPEDGRCMCCGKHLRELKPFGKGENQSCDDHSGALLVKHWIWGGFLPEEEDLRFMEEFFQDCGPEETPELSFMRAEERFIQKNGKKKAEIIIPRIKAISSQLTTTWLCKDCSVLDGRQCHEKKMAQDRTAGPLIQAKPMPA